MRSRLRSRLSGAWNNLPLRTKGFIVIAVPLAAMIGATCLCVAGKLLSDRADARVSQSVSVQHRAQGVLTLLVDSETGLRGYLLTKDRLFLAPHEHALFLLPAALDQLKNSLAGDRLSLAPIEQTIRDQARRELDVQRAAAECFERDGMSREVRAALQNGKEIMDSLRADFARLTLLEEKSLRERRADSRRVSEFFVLCVIGIGLLGMVIGVAVITLFTRGIAGRIETLVKYTAAAKNERSFHLHIAGNDEVGRLAATMRETSAELALRAQESHQSREAAERASIVKGEFLAHMSHEVRTPLNGIIGLTDLVLETELSSTQRDHLDMVRYSADALLLLANDILDLSKIEAGKLVFESIRFDLREMLTKTCQTLQTRATSKALRMTTAFSEELPRFVLGDPLRLRQVLINVIDNAIKFTQEGEVAVQVSCRPGSPGGVELLFAVVDSGVGIPFEKQELIFQAFSQADESTTRQFGGTGLGLAICAQLVAGMGGSIFVESTPGKGSVFHFTAELKSLPEEIAPAPAAPVAKPVSSLPGLCILIADDNEVNRVVAAGIVERAGHRAVLARDGHEAVARLAAGHFDAVLMDVQMPGLDGFGATARIRELEQPMGRRTPIIAMTAYAGPDDEGRCLGAGMDGYLAKPVRRQLLLDALAKFLGNKATVEQPLILEAAGETFCINDLLERIDNDYDLFAKLVVLFRTHTPEMLGKIDASIAAGDADALERSAHSLVGSLANLGARRAAELAREIERFGLDADFENARSVLSLLRHETDPILTRLGAALERLRSTDPERASAA